MVEAPWHHGVMSDETKRGALPTATLPTVEREIGGVLYEVTRLPYWDLLTNLKRAEQLLGPALTSALHGDAPLDDLGALLGGPAGVLAQGARVLVQRFTDDNGRALQEALGKQTIVHPDGRSVRLLTDKMGIWFGQNPGHVLLWLTFCLEVQFRDFFATPGSALEAYLRAKGLIEDRESSSESKGDEL